MTNEPDPQAGATVKTIDPHTGEPPVTRVQEASSVFSICEKFILDDEKRARDRTRINGLINGRRPYDRRKLRALGQAWRANCDYGTAGSLIEEVHATYWDLITEVPYLVRATVRRKMHQDSVTRRRWSEFISTKIHELVTEEWPDFYVEMALLLDEMVRFGRSHVLMEDQFDWRFTAGKVNALLMPDASTVRRESVPMLGLVDHMPVHELFDHLRAKHANWDEETIRQVIWNSRKSTGEKEVYSPHNFEAWETSRRNNDMHTSYVDCESVKVYHLFVREFDGRVSHLIVDGKQSRTSFLFEGRGRFKNFEEAIFPVYRHYGDGYAHGVEGIGHKCFNLCELENRAMNSGMDSMMVGGSIVIKNVSGDENSHGSKILKIGPVIEPPPGYEFDQNLIGGNTSFLFGGVRFLQRQLMDVLAVNRRETLQEDGSPVTATQAAIDSADRANLKKSAVTFFYLQLDRIYKQMVKRMLKSSEDAVQDMIEECIEYGIPEEVLSDTLSGLKIKAARTLGAGSEVVRRRIAATAEKFIPFFDQVGRKEAVRFNISASGGGMEAAELFMADDDRNRIPTTETTLITLENRHLGAGEQLPAGIDQDHIIHLQEHMPLLQQAAQAGTVQGSDLESAYRMLSAGIPHAYEHAEYMAQNPVDEGRAKEVVAALQALENSLNQIAQQLGAQVEAQQSAALAAQEQQAGGEQFDRQAKVLEIQANADAKYQADIYKENNQQEIRLMREKNKSRVVSSRE